MRLKNLEKNPSVYIYNDLPDLKINHRNMYEKKLLGELIKAVSANSNVTLIDVDTQIKKLTKRKDVIPFSLTLAIGSSGLSIAQKINSQTNWFPKIQVLPIYREEVSPNTYDIIFDPSILHDLPPYSSLAIVDDTVYSGSTIRVLLKSLPKAQLATTQIFLLQGVTKSIKTIEKTCPVLTALKIPGVIEEESIIIKFSGLFTTGAIRRVNKRSLAFFERQDWIRNWFPSNSDKIISLSKELHGIKQNNYLTL